MTATQNSQTTGTQTINARSMGQPTLENILQQAGFSAAATQTISARPPRHATLPATLHPKIQTIIEGKFPAGIYSHQAKAIELSLEGHDVCLSTPTASGKSLPFMALAAHELLGDAQARVLVIYPARALIQDQLLKWNAMLEPLALQAGLIDGGVPAKERVEVLRRRRVVLMTPDVAHAWLMSNLNEKAVAAFRSNLRLLILDEAHVYDGVFGTNMAFFLRRLQAVSSKHRLICSTATLGRPGDFIEQLTGRDVTEIGGSADGAQAPEKEIILAHSANPDSFDSSVALVRQLAQSYKGRFLVFGDSRKLVEVVTAASHRNGSASDETEGADSSALSSAVLPYRSGYESTDRAEIQKALSSGALHGVVATSALEIGLDIGEIDLVVLLETPASMKSFWQRLGRAGRRNHGSCVILDGRRAIAPSIDGLNDYLARPIEPNWLYLENRYAQYTNALCAAAEIGQINGSFNREFFKSLPRQFNDFLANELEPTTQIAPDLYPLKQTAQNEPHHEFPLRSGIEKNLKVLTRQGERCGEVSYAQALREAYPGAVYHYMAKPYRVTRFNYRDGEIIVARERHYTTKPTRHAMAFPELAGKAFQMQVSESGFLAETELQVSERVTGFKEKQGSVEASHVYGPGSPYSQQALTRLIRTTGVCWAFQDPLLASESIAKSIAEAFCGEHGIQPRDIGISAFHSTASPLGAGVVNGFCIFDTSNGSLRLTERLGTHFANVVRIAHEKEKARGNADLAEKLAALLDELKSLSEFQPPSTAMKNAPLPSDEWVKTIAPGSKAILHSTSGAEEVMILGCLYTPIGVRYQLQHPSPTTSWTVEASALEPIAGLTTFRRYNVMTGETASVC